MITTLPVGIGSIEQAKAFLSELAKNNEHYHPEDDAMLLVPDKATIEEAESLNALMLDIYNLPGNDGRHSGVMAFDPCEFLFQLVFIS
jgi:hypothetical protein